MNRNRIERGWFGLSTIFFDGVTGDYFPAEKAIGADSSLRLGPAQKAHA
jgi:hypothetical protein